MYEVPIAIGIEGFEGFEMYEVPIAIGIEGIEEFEESETFNASRIQVRVQGLQRLKTSV